MARASHTLSFLLFLRLLEPIKKVLFQTFAGQKTLRLPEHMRMHTLRRVEKYLLFAYIIEYSPSSPPIATLPGPVGRGGSVFLCAPKRSHRRRPGRELIQQLHKLVHVLLWRQGQQRHGKRINDLLFCIQRHAINDR
jgi:hypothetical protein